jgi:hypothetical protein
MSKFAEELIAATNSAASAYIQFATDHSSGSYDFFVFVEDTPDIIIYQHVIQRIGASFLPCGGKDGVFSVFQKLVQEGRADGQCFITDRDVEDFGELLPTAIFRTKGYSWENHVCERDATIRTVQLKSRPNFTLQEAHGIADSWEATVQNFDELLRTHLGLLRLNSIKSLELDLASFPICLDAKFENGRLFPGDTASNWLKQKLVAAEIQGITKADIQDAIGVNKHISLMRQARGKTLFTLWKRFIASAFSEFGKKGLGDLKSALSVIQSFPWDWPDFNYIRAYVDTRVGVAI